MNNRTGQNQKGFIGILLLILIALALLKYLFDWSIFDAAESERGRATVVYIRQVLSLTWHYLAVPAEFLWQYALKPLIDMLIHSRAN